jgi:hypothetical protein
MTATPRVTKTQMRKALEIVAAWMGSKEGTTALPTGPDAARRGIGPDLVPDWDWSGRPTPTVILEANWDWTFSASSELQAEFTKIGLWAEPYSSFALSLYRD